MEIRITVTGLQEILSNNQQIMNEYPNTLKQINQQLSKIWLDDAKNNIHVISGKTKQSMKITQVNDKFAEITAGFGARFEERRPGSKPPPIKGSGTGPHRFSLHANQVTVQQLPSIVKQNIDSLLARHKSN